MLGAHTIELTHPNSRLECLPGIHTSIEWLRRGLGVFLWARGRSTASLHQRAAKALSRIQTVKQTTEGLRYDLAGSFVQFLFEREGEERFRMFFRCAEKIDVDSAARAVFGRELLDLEIEWESEVRSRMTAWSSH